MRIDGSNGGELLLLVVLLSCHRGVAEYDYFVLVFGFKFFYIAVVVIVHRGVGLRGITLHSFFGLLGVIALKVFLRANLVCKPRIIYSRLDLMLGLFQGVNLKILIFWRREIKLSNVFLSSKNFPMLQLLVPE